MRERKERKGSNHGRKWIGEGRGRGRSKGKGRDRERKRERTGTNGALERGW